MAIFRLDDRDPSFPDARLAEPAGSELAGLLAVGGDLSPTRLLNAYRGGIFPWYSAGQPILWWSPDPRMVLRPAELHVSRSLRRRMRRGDFRVTLDEAFEQVIAACASTPRPGQPGTWITPEMQAAYCELFRLGHAHSCEAWAGNQLAGGVYGLATGGVFCAESMFRRADDASKVALTELVGQLERRGFVLIDCQFHTDFLASIGAREISRERYLAELAAAADRPAPPPPAPCRLAPDSTSQPSIEDSGSRRRGGR